MKTHEQCQVCGKEIKGKVYHWHDDPRLPMHPNLIACGDPQLFADWLNANADYINGKGDPVLRRAETCVPTSS